MNMVHKDDSEKKYNTYGNWKWIPSILFCLMRSADQLVCSMYFHCTYGPSVSKAVNQLVYCGSVCADDLPGVVVLGGTHPHGRTPSKCTRCSGGDGPQLAGTINNICRSAIAMCWSDLETCSHTRSAPLGCERQWKGTPLQYSFISFGKTSMCCESMHVGPKRRHVVLVLLPDLHHRLHGTFIPGHCCLHPGGSLPGGGQPQDCSTHHRVGLVCRTTPQGPREEEEGLTHAPQFRCVHS